MVVFIIVVFKSIIIPCKHGLDCSCSSRSPLCTILGNLSSESFYTYVFHDYMFPGFTGSTMSTMAIYCKNLHLLSPAVILPPFNVTKPVHTSLAHDIHNWFDAYPSSKFMRDIYPSWLHRTSIESLTSHYGATFQILQL